MKIALLTPTFSAFSGIDRVVELQAEELMQAGNQVTIFTLKAGIKTSKAKIVEIGMPKNQFMERIYRLLLFFDFLKIRKYGKMLKNYDQVISHLYPMNLFAMFAKKNYGVEYVYHNHGVATPNLFQGKLEKTYMKLFWRLTNLTVKKCSKAVSISRYLQQKLKEETDINSEIVYDQIDHRRFNKTVSGEKIREKYQLGNEFVCLYVGRISPHKGIDLLIKSINLAKKKIPNIKLLIVGKPTFSDYFNKLKKDPNESIIFTGFVPDEELPFYYAACNVYTTATLWEGFNMTVVEAQACGKAVVAFNMGPHPEVVKNGKLVKIKDINAFAEGIVEIKLKGNHF